MYNPFVQMAYNFGSNWGDSVRKRMADKDARLAAEAAKGFGASQPANPMFQKPASYNPFGQVDPSALGGYTAEDVQNAGIPNQSWQGIANTATGQPVYDFNTPTVTESLMGMPNMSALPNVGQINARGGAFNTDLAKKKSDSSESEAMELNAEHGEPRTASEVSNAVPPDITSEEYIPALRQYLRNQGFGSDSIDRYLAQSNIEGIQREKRTASLMDSIRKALDEDNFALADDNMARLAEYNPQVAASLMGRSPSFKNIWGENLQDARWQRNYEADLAKMDKNFNNQLAYSQYKEQMRQNAQMQGYLERAYQAQQAGLNEEEARQYILTGKYYRNTDNGTSSGTSSGTSNGNKLSATQQKNINAISNQANDIITAIEAGQESGDKLQSFIQDTEKMISTGALDDETVRLVRNLQYWLHGYREEQAGNVEMARQYYNAVNPEYMAMFTEG